tara:strand:+ start:2166 stop:3002 length:837 start_codon:yes stop_codon:yes gene_type:complete
MKHYFFPLFFLLFISCIKEDNKNFADSLSNVHGVEYKIVKQDTLQEGFVVVKNQQTGAYTAYNLSGYSSSMNQNEFKKYLDSLPPEGKVTNLEKGIEEVNQSVTEWVDTSHYGHEWVYDEESGGYVESPVWIEEGHWETYDKKVKMTVYKAQNGLMFEEDTYLSKDLEKWGALLEKSKEEVFQSILINQFGLSEKRSVDVSRILINIKKIRAKRSLREEDMKNLSLTLFGVPFSFLKKSYADGSEREKDEIISQVAEFNETDPESIKKILNLAFTVQI